MRYQPSKNFILSTCWIFIEKKYFYSVNKCWFLFQAYGGLRGAVAFSLADMLDKDESQLSQMFVTSTLAVIIFTVFVQVIRYLSFTVFAIQDFYWSDLIKKLHELVILIANLNSTIRIKIHQCVYICLKIHSKNN